MTAHVAAIAFLVTSLVSLTVYLVAFVGLLRQPPSRERAAYRGLLRTSVSRIVVACMYVTFAITVTVLGDRIWPGTSFVVFTLAQVCWQTNSALDMRLKKRIRKGTT